MHWLVLGTGPTAEQFMHRPEPDLVITSNRGLELWPDADVYWVSDPAAIEIFRPLWEKYEGLIVSPADLGRETVKFEYREHGNLFHGRVSGICCARYALSLGATELSFVGHDGYDASANRMRPDGTVHRALGKTGARDLNDAMEAALANMAEWHPYLKVTWYGEPRFKLPPRWEQIIE